MMERTEIVKEITMLDKIEKIEKDSDENSKAEIEALTEAEIENAEEKKLESEKESNIEEKVITESPISDEERPVVSEVKEDKDNDASMENELVIGPESSSLDDNITSLANW